MGSMGNWLGFSLSPHHPDNTLINSDEISGAAAADCFDLPPNSHHHRHHHQDSSSSSLPPPHHPPYGFLQAFNTTNNHSQDWGMGTSPQDINSMIMNNNGSCNSHHQQHHHQEPKLENFFGAHNYNNNNNIPSTSSLQPVVLEPENSTIGLSMIKNWLRNQPAPAPDTPSNGGGSLSLSMGSGTHPAGGSSSSSTTVNPLPLLPTASAVVMDGGDHSTNLSGGGSTSNSTNLLDTQININAANMDVVSKKSIDTFGQRTSIYRGVTRHRWTGRYEAHLWDNSCRREGQTRKGRQVYLGGYDKEDKAARAYDLAALKYWGNTTTTNFPITSYEKELEEMKHMTRQEYVASLRRKSSGFSRGASIYRGVTRHHQHGRWQARIGRVAGNKDLYLGTFTTQEEAAEAYDIAAIKFRGLNAVTNFDMTRYDVKSILESSTLPIGAAAKRLKDAEQTEMIMASDISHQRSSSSNNIGNMNDGSMIGSYQNWPMIGYHQSLAPSLGVVQHYPYNQQQRPTGVWSCKQEQDLSNYHLQLGNSTNNTHNFFQNSIMQQNLIMDQQQSSGSNIAMYGNGDVNGAFAMPIANVVCQNDGNGTHEYGGSEHDHHQVLKTSVYEGIFGSSDPYNHSRNMYCNIMTKPEGYENEQGSSNCNNWSNISNDVPSSTTLSAPIRTIYHGAPPFTLWNDA